MLTKHYIHQLNAAFSRDIRQSNDPTMKDVVHVDKSRKIRIYGYQNTCFLRRLFKEFSVARIGTQCARFKDVMAFIHFAAIPPVFDLRIDQRGISSDFGLLPGQDLNTIQRILGDHGMRVGEAGANIRRLKLRIILQ
jgi:hypothetical protein